MSSIKPVIPPFNRLVTETLRTAGRLVETIQLNWIYYYLISGKGLEFDRLKEYVPGLDPRRIDWKVLARLQKPYVRMYKEEREFDVIFAIDVSDTMLLGTTDRAKNEFAALLAGTFAYAATEAGDNVAVMMHSSRVKLITDPDGDFYKVVRILSQEEYYGGEKHWEDFTISLLNNYAEESILFIISDFINTNPRRFLPQLAAHFSKVYGLMVRDPIDIRIPPGVGRMYLRDPTGRKFYLTDLDKIRVEYEYYARKEIENVRRAFREAGQLFLLTVTGEDFATAFIKALGNEKVIVS